MKDTGVSDRHALTPQMRVMPVDLSPHGFDKTYEVPGRDDLLMRRNGAVYAIFDNMEYERDKRFKYHKVFKAVVPAATIFYIGKPDFNAIPSTGIRARDMRFQEPPPPPPSRAEEGVHGVQPVKVHALGPELLRGQSERVDARVQPEAPGEAKVVNVDISYPAVPKRPQLEPAKPATPPATERTTRPALESRIDDLVSRASKDS